MDTGIQGFRGLWLQTRGLRASFSFRVSGVLAEKSRLFLHPLMVHISLQYHVPQNPNPIPVVQSLYYTLLVY